MSLEAQLDHLYQTESRRILATLIRLLSDFDLAEDALHDAFLIAAEKWPHDGVPDNPRAWLISTGRFKAIDKLRRKQRFETPLPDNSPLVETEDFGTVDHIEDDTLRLIFTCCHPKLSREARLALTLREVCGLTTEEIAHAFLTKPTTLAQRIVRAKAKIRKEKIPYEIPAQNQLAERLDTVLQVVYLLFNEGYSASMGERVTRPKLTREGVRIGRILANLLPEPEVYGLLALMLLQESRHMTRTSADGDLILLADQDRSQWDQALIDEGVQLVQQAFAAGPVGLYTLQAAIAATHATAPSFDATNWLQIIALYDGLQLLTPSPVVQLNRAVAVAMAHGASAGLAQIDELLTAGKLTDYHLIYAVKADLLRRNHQLAAAQTAYQQALALAQQEPERRFLQAQLREIATNLTNL